MSNPSKFGEMLTQAVRRIKSIENQSISTIQSELGYALGRTSDSAIEYWRQGNIPANDDLERLTKIVVQRGQLDREWTEKFLQAAGHLYPNAFLSKVFPASNTQTILSRAFTSSNRRTPYNETYENKHSELIEPLQQDIKKFLNRGNNTFPADNMLPNLFLIRKLLHERSLTRNQAVQQVLLNAIDELSDLHEQEAKFLRARVESNVTMEALAKDFDMSASHLYRLQKKAVDLLVEVVQTKETQAIQQQQAILYSRMQTSNSEQLVGVEDHLQNLMEYISNPEPPWIIFIQGIGGIGKTSLAAELCRRVIEDLIYDEIAWTSVSTNLFMLSDDSEEKEKAAATTAQSVIDGITHQLIPELSYERLSHEECLERIHSRLVETPHLIVIDNLETLEDVQMLLPKIQRLANPTKFILTSRKHPVTNASIHSFVVPPLNELDSLKLLRQEVQITNLLSLDDQNDELFREIYDVVGGNPLALRLVIGQARYYSVKEILAELRDARDQPIEQLYRHIYQWAWDELGEEEREIFLGMLMVNRWGDTLSYITDVSDVDLVFVQNTLRKLVVLNLVHIDNSDPNEFLYSIHSLTRTFLQNQIGGWW